MTRIVLLVALVYSFAGNFKCQFFPEDYEFYRMKPSIGMSFGSSNYIGDLATISGVSHLAPGGVQIIGDYPISQSFVAKASFAYHRLSYVNVFENDFANFKTRMGGLNLGAYYRFDNDVIMPTNKNLSLRVGAGFSFFYSKSKADLYDADGTRYYFWNTGLHKDRPMDDPDASEAIDLIRDYDFETEIEDAPTGVPTPYGEISMMYRLLPRMTAGLTYEHHFTFSDLIDGNDSKTRKDQFNYLSLSISYSISEDFRAEEKKIVEELDQEDEDDDGVVNVLDRCPGTKINVEVDEHGCALDSDKDGVADYMDKEPNTPEGATVNENGRAYTEEEILVIDLLSSGYMKDNENWQMYMEKYPSLFDRYGFIPLEEEKTIIGKEKE